MKRRRPGLVAFAFSHAKDAVAVLLLVGMGIAGLNHFATAADVQQKFGKLETKIDLAVMEARKARIEDELFRLRTGSKDKGSQAQIERFESELRNVNARIRDPERK